MSRTLDNEPSKGSKLEEAFKGYNICSNKVFIEHRTF